MRKDKAIQIRNDLLLALWETRDFGVYDLRIIFKLSLPQIYRVLKVVEKEENLNKMIKEDEELHLGTTKKKKQKRSRRIVKDNQAGNGEE